MAFADITLNLSNVTFDTINGVITAQDVEASGGSDIVAQGETLNNVETILFIDAPDGQQWYTGTFSGVDIDYDVSTSSVNTMRFAVLSSSGNDTVYQQGTYRITMTMRQISTGATISRTLEYEYCKDAPEIVIDWGESSCLCYPLIRAMDRTDWNPVGETAWTVTAKTQTLTGPRAASYSSASPTVTILDSGSDNLYTGQYNLLYTATIQRTVGGVTTICNYSNNYVYDLQCLQNCDIKCILNKLEARAAGGDEYYKNIYQQAAAISEHIDRAAGCGDGSKVSELIIKLKALAQKANCDECTSPSGGLIVPICQDPAATNVTVTEGPGIDVSSGPNYQVSLEPVNVTNLANNYVTEVDAGSDISVSGPVIDATTNPPTHTYTVASAGPGMYAGIIRINFRSGASPSVPPANGHTVIEENNFKTGTFNAMASWGTTADPAGATLGHAAHINISNFMVSPTTGDTWVPIIQLVDDAVATRIQGFPISTRMYQRQTGFTTEITVIFHDGYNEYTFGDIANTYAYLDLSVMFIQK